MRANPEEKMTAFNQKILQYQEDAYTLAVYLLGCNEAAARAVQSAVLMIYHRGANNPRLNLLQAVIQTSAQPHSRAHAAASGLDARLLALPQNERRAAVLVDVLGLNYAEAAQVLRCTPGQISGWLTRARMQFMQVM